MIRRRPRCGVRLGRLSLPFAALLAVWPASAQLRADENRAQLAADAAQSSAETEAAGRNVRCKTGPVVKQLGGTYWIVFSCDDSKSLIFLSDQRNPAFPFMFVAMAKDDRYEVRGQGEGDKDAAAPAFEALMKMPATDLFALVEETQAVPDDSKPPVIK